MVKIFEGGNLVVKLVVKISIHIKEEHKKSLPNTRRMLRINIIECSKGYLLKTAFEWKEKLYILYFDLDL